MARRDNPPGLNERSLKALKDLARSSGRQAAGCFSVRLATVASGVLGHDTEAVLARHVETALDQALSEFDLWLPIGPGRYLIAFSKQDANYGSSCLTEAERLLFGRLTSSAPALSGHVSVARQLFELDRQSFQLMTDAAPPPGRDDDLAILSQTNEVVFEPVWDVSRGAIIEYVAGPASYSCGARFGDVEGPQERKHAFETDMKTLEALRSEFASLAKLPGQPLLSAKLQAASFANVGSASEMSRTLHALPETDRKRLTINVYEVRDGASARDAQRAQETLAPLVRSMRFVSPLDESNHEAARGYGYSEIGLDLSLYDGVPERSIMPMLEVFFERAARARHRPFLFGAPTRSLCSYAICSGAALLSGPAIGERLTAAAPALRYGIEDMYPVKGAVQ